VLFFQPTHPSRPPTHHTSSFQLEAKGWGATRRSDFNTARAVAYTMRCLSTHIYVASCLQTQVYESVARGEFSLKFTILCHLPFGNAANIDSYFEKTLRRGNFTVVHMIETKFLCTQRQQESTETLCDWYKVFGDNNL
jgi:hypothetical protein